MSFRAICPTYSYGENDNHTLLVTFAKQLGPALVADGLLAADEFNDLVYQLESRLANPETITIYSLLCQAWALKPAGEREYQEARPQ
jgi:hypothetical protein